MSQPKVLLLDEIQDDTVNVMNEAVPGVEFIDARTTEVRDEHLPTAEIIYGFLPLDQYDKATSLKWLQLLSAGVPRRLCPIAKNKNFIVTNLAGLYGPSIAEHTVTVMSMLCRNLHIAMQNQFRSTWDATINKTMRDLSGQTAAIIGLGDIGRNIARMCKNFGMRVVGTRRRPQPTPFVDQVYAANDLQPMLAEADFVIVATALTPETTDLLGTEEFGWMKKGVFFVNVSRGAVAQESVLLEALRSGHVAGAALDVFLEEPLPADHPYWQMPNVIVTPHYCGDTVNNSTMPMQRFLRNLRSWLAGEDLEYVVDLDSGY